MPSADARSGHRAERAGQANLLLGEAQGGVEGAGAGVVRAGVQGEVLQAPGGDALGGDALGQWWREFKDPGAVPPE